ncbi:MAG: hypothetical protein HZA63_07985 [Rhodocyclales bacterium]|nr:hypothetical protein [Rhodocyclales bacterium]
MSKNNLNKKIEMELGEAYASGRRHNISLPNSNEFRLSGTKEKLRLSLTARAVVCNMQDDIAAFEGWLLALKAWNCITRVELHWDIPENIDDGHYQRFLYRVTWFNKLFSSWLSVAPECHAYLDESKVKGTLVVNSAAGTPTDDHADKSKEAKLEKYLADSDWLANTFALAKVGRQFPVGLFQDEVSNKTKIFTGGKSAIDLVGIEPEQNRLWVFELKAENNSSMGIVSELLFYVSFMCNVVKGDFTHVNGKPEVKGRLHHLDLNDIKKIRGCFLAPKFHPLLDDNRVVEQLNVASWPDGIDVDFCLEKLPDAVLARNS